jgi:hypothetical protein
MLAAVPSKRAFLLCAAALVAAAVATVPATVAGAGTSTPPATRLAYVTSTGSSPLEQVGTAGGDGSGRMLLGPGDDPLIAPSGLVVAASLFGTGGGLERGPAIALYSTAGAAPRQFGNLARWNATPLAWSPDSRYLALDLRSTNVREIARRSGLAVRDTTNGSLRTLASGIVYGASFAPGGSDTIVFARAGSESLAARVDLYTVAARGGSPRRITSDGRSLNPVWGPTYIAYDREQLRREDAPVYQIWLRRPGARGARRLTSIRVRSLVSGLVPLAFSSSGARMLAEFEGQDTSEAWTVEVPSGRARRMLLGGRVVVGSGLSRDGATVLGAQGGLEGPPSSDNVVTVPFAGGPATVLVSHAGQPSWNG